MEGQDVIEIEELNNILIEYFPRNKVWHVMGLIRKKSYFDKDFAKGKE